MSITSPDNAIYGSEPEIPETSVFSPCNTVQGLQVRRGTGPCLLAACPSCGRGRKGKGPSAGGLDRGTASAGRGTDPLLRPCQAHTAAQGSPGEREGQIEDRPIRFLVKSSNLYRFVKHLASLIHL